jgi:hypothetical protein
VRRWILFKSSKMWAGGERLSKATGIRLRGVGRQHFRWRAGRCWDLARESVFSGCMGTFREFAAEGLISKDPAAPHALFV